MATVDNRLPTEGTQLDIVAALGTIASSLPSQTTEGHVIENDSGTGLAQQDNLQFVGTHTTNQTGKTVVNVTRQMTLAEYNLLSADEKKGIIQITDEYERSLNINDLEGIYANTVYPRETSPSTHAYAQGDHLVFNGYTYKAKTAIAVGDNLVVNTNIQAETLATRMNHIEQGIYDASNIVKQVSYTGTTNSAGYIQGATTDFGMSANAIPIGAYLERGNYSALRYVEILAYGSKGVSFGCFDSGTAIASSLVTLSIVYVDRQVNN